MNDPEKPPGLSKRTRWIIALLVAFTVIYPLSFGPVLLLCGVSPSIGEIPPLVRIIYAPLLSLPTGWWPKRLLNRSVEFWIGTD